ncbi:hypothetical protein Mapa_002936 [Marchantia paleacea]|nr:hypothetical protein Mapa_002936 [Marchantia paleacea]
MKPLYSHVVTSHPVATVLVVKLPMDRPALQSRLGHLDVSLAGFGTQFMDGSLQAMPSEDVNSTSSHNPRRQLPRRRTSGRMDGRDTLNLTVCARKPCPSGQCNRRCRDELTD